MILSDLLTASREAILEAASTGVSRAHLLHYEEDGGIRERLAELYDVTVACVGDRRVQRMLDHIQEVAEHRFEAGFDLGEIQVAFNVLEEAIWREIERQVPPQELGECLGLVTTVLGVGKDRLARAYVVLAARTHAPAIDLDALARGAD
ncbi:MAG: hypothetical protein R3E12_20440 [Candidatus Eisenbacteria bacterium]